MTDLDNNQRFLPPPPPPPPDDDGNVPCEEPSDESATESGDDWTGNSVPWNPEIPDLKPSHNPFPEAGLWNVPNSDFTPPASPFALELRAESIEQLAGGDALRRGESERIEAGRSGGNSDAVAGRDRVHVQGSLHEHTGHGLAEHVAHLDTTVDRRLDVHAGEEDMVLLAGHMKDVWDGGTAIVAAMTDDLVAGGGVRVTAPLDLWVHGVMGVEERIGTCTADAVLLELGGTHYEREYGPGAHAAGLAVYTGSLYQSSRSTFRALMRVSSGVRNLIPGGGSGGAGDGAGGAPVASPPPVPAAGGAGTEAVSETFSTATGSARSVEAVVEAGARSDDLTGVRHFPDTPDAVHTDEITTLDNQAVIAQLDALLDDIRQFYDETGDLTEAARSTNAAEQLAALQRADIAEFDSLLQALNQSILEIEEPVSPHTLGVEDSVAPPSLGGTDDLHHAGEPHDAHSPVPGSDEADLDLSRLDEYQRPDMEEPQNPADASMERYVRSLTDQHWSDRHSDEADLNLSRFEGYELPDMEEPQNPADATWETNFRAFTDQLQRHRHEWNWVAVYEYEPAATRIVDEVTSAYWRLGGRVEDLGPTRDKFVQAHEAYRGLEQMLLEADQANDLQRAAEIRGALDEINQHTYDVVVDFASRLPDFSAELLPKLAPNIDPTKLEGWVQQQIDNAMIDVQEANGLNNTEDIRLAQTEFDFWTGVRHEIRAGRNPTVNSGAQITHLHSIDQHAQADELAVYHDRLRDIMGDTAMLRRYIDPTKLRGWVRQQIGNARLDLREANLESDTEDFRLAQTEFDFWLRVRREIRAGRDPTVYSGAQITHLHSIDQHAQADELAVYHDRLRDIMSDTAMLGPGPAVGTFADAAFPGSLVSDPVAKATVGGPPEVVHLTESEIELITRPAGDGTGSGLGAATDRHEILDPNVHADRLRMWAADQLDYGMFKLEDPILLSDSDAVARLLDEFDFYRAVRSEAAEGHNPAVWGHHLMTRLFEESDTERAQQIAELQMVLHDAMSDPWIRTPTAPVDDSLSPGRADASTGAAPQTSPPDLNVPTTESEFRFGPGDSGPGSDGAVPQLTPDSAAWQVEPGASRPPDTDIGYSSIQWHSGRLPTGAEGSHSTTSPGSTHGALLPETGAGTPLPTDGGLHRRPTGMQRPLHEASFGGAQAAETSGLQGLGGRPPGWQADETPGFGRVAADSGSFPVSRREQIVSSLKRGDLMSDVLIKRLARRYADATISGEIDLFSSQSREMTETIGELSQITGAARRAGSSTADYSDIDYPALYLLLAMLETHPSLS